MNAVKLDRPLRLATRGSALALAQTELVAEALRRRWPGLAVEPLIIRTTGDQDQRAPITSLGDGAFVRGIERALLTGEADAAMHSAKDVPTTEPPGLVLAAFLPGPDARDVLVSRSGLRFSALPPGVRLGTGSPRRMAVARSLRPDLEVQHIRGNVDTRLAKLAAGEYDAIVLAAAGLLRLGRSEVITEYLDPGVWIPPPGQGTIAVQCAGDSPLLDLIQGIDDGEAHARIAAERAVLRRLGSGCRTPLGAHATVERGVLRLRGALLSPDGQTTVIAERRGAVADAEQIGTDLADELLRNGARLMVYAPEVATPAPVVQGASPAASNESEVGQRATAPKDANSRASTKPAGVGRVTLVGAGPGDPGLITVAGLRALREADVVVYDRLASPALRREARPDAEMIDAGKVPGNHGLGQEGINSVLIEQARAGRTVVRLKGGDPFVFGRGGEEGLALRDAGIPFTVVPGISSAIAAPAYAGIPVTHRGVAGSLFIATGHEAADGPGASHNWEAVARAADTLVFLMGVERLLGITEQLIAAGRPATQPAALVRWGTTPEQTVLTSTLGEIATLARERGLKPPAALVVGDVVGLREGLAWFERAPLFGARVLVTRTREQASGLVARLLELGAVPLEFPAIGIAPVEDVEALDLAVGRAGSYDWTVLSSVNGVEALAARLDALGLDARALAGTRLCAVGPVTAAALRQHGLRADLVPEPHTTEGVLAALQAQGITGKRVLLLRPDIAPPALSDGLRAAGADVTEVTAYRTITGAGRREELERLLAGGLDAVTFTASSTVKGLMETFGGDTAPLRGALVASIGPQTSATARGYGLTVDVEAEPSTIEGLVTALVHEWTRRKGAGGA